MQLRHPHWYSHGHPHLNSHRQPRCPPASPTKHHLLRCLLPCNLLAFTSLLYINWAPTSPMQLLCLDTSLMGDIVFVHMYGVKSSQMASHNVVTVLPFHSFFVVGVSHTFLLRPKSLTNIFTWFSLEYTLAFVSKWKTQHLCKLPNCGMFCSSPPP